MNIDYLLSFKNHIDVQNFNINITDDNLFKNYKYDKNKYYIKKQPLKKDTTTIINKFNFILNKLSETNFNNIILEFIESINYITIDEYNDFLKTIYIKILSDINFINLYLKFIELINYIYYNVLNHNLSFLINIVNKKFNLDYLNEKINDDNYNFINEFDNPTYRINNIRLIKNLYNYELISIESYNSYEDILLTSNIYIADIYYWKPIMNEINIVKLHNILSNKLNIRDKVLIENLLNNNNNTELDYIIDNYITNNIIDEIINYINNYCKDNISKTNLCKNIIEIHIKKMKSRKYYFSLKEYPEIAAKLKLSYN